MTIECYYDTCRYHGTHHGDEGPFCFESDCRATEYELQLHGRIRELTCPNLNTTNATPELNEGTIKKLLKKFFHYLDITEESDSGRTFHPTTITSCRAEDGAVINEILKQLKEMIQ